MRTSVPIKTANGFPGVTPSLSLKYSSTGSSSTLGIGWSLSVPSVERMTSRGLPTYTTDDLFAGDGEDMLVFSGTNSDGARVYRKRFEKEFLRYTWHDSDTGAAGYWTAENPDGTVSYFGADANGNTVASARVGHTDGRTFKYLLFEKVDPFGHVLRYGYTKDGHASLLTTVSWVFDAGGAPAFTVDLAYEDRPDALSDCRAGYEELLTKRLTTVTVKGQGQTIRSYDLTYQDDAASGGFTRLQKVERRGRDGGLNGIVMSFAYSQGLGVLCANDDCDKPTVVSVGKLEGGGVDLSTGNATLIDINGDSLPDILDSSQDGPHRFFLNEIDSDGTQRFLSAVGSAVGTKGGFSLASPFCQVLDVNGDGFTDIVNKVNGSVLLNHGTGDWRWAESRCNQSRRYPRCFRLGSRFG